jgi:hypothetical protein
MLHNDATRNHHNVDHVSNASAAMFVMAAESDVVLSALARID